MPSPETPAHPQRDFRFVIAGAVVLCAALGGFYLSSQPQHAANEWLRMGSMAAVLVGIILFMLSGMAPEHRRDWIRQGLVALAVALLIRWSVGEPYRIPSGSMEPTLLGDERIGRGDRVLVNKWVYGVRYPFMNKRIWHGQPPQRWDMVVFKTVEDGAQHGTLVKRIVGMPGERIHITGGKVYADGMPLALPEFMSSGIQYTSPQGRFTEYRYGIWTDDKYAVIPEGHYLVLGDNSGQSRDGRAFGWLPNEHIVGRVSCIWWPPHRWSDFTGFTQTWWWNTLLALLAASLVTRLFLARSWHVHGTHSESGGHYLVLFVAYGLRIPFTLGWLKRWNAPKRGELVLYAPDSPLAEPGAVTLGRVVALAGEKVCIKENGVEVNDVPLELPDFDPAGYASADPDALYGRGKGKKHTVVPEGMCFILSGAPEQEAALDSRTLGWVPEARVVGRARWVWWPPSQVRKVP